VGISQLSGHVQFEVIIVVLDGITQLNLHDTSICQVLLLEEDRLDCGVDVLLNVFNQHRLSIADGSTDLPLEVRGLREVEDL